MKYSFKLLLALADSFYKKGNSLLKNADLASSQSTPTESKQSFYQKNLSDIADWSAQRYGQKQTLQQAREYLKGQWEKDEPYKRIATSVGDNEQRVRSSLEKEIQNCIANMPVIFVSYSLVKELEKLKMPIFDDIVQYEFGGTGECVLTGDRKNDFVIVNMSPPGSNPDIGQIPTYIYITIVHELRHAIFEIINDKYPNYSSSTIGKEEYSQYESSKDYMRSEEYKTQPTEQFARIEEFRNIFKLGYNLVTVSDLVTIFNKFPNFKNGYLQDLNYKNVARRRPNGFVDRICKRDSQTIPAKSILKTPNPGKDRNIIIDDFNGEVIYNPTANWIELKSIGGKWDDSYTKENYQSYVEIFSKSITDSALRLFFLNFTKPNPVRYFNNGLVYVDMIDYEKMARALNEWAYAKMGERNVAIA